MNPSTQFFRRLTAACAGACVALLAIPVSAQTTATTDPVGFITLTVAGGAGNGKLSFEGLGLTQPVLYQGSAETVTVATKTIQDNDATWTDNQFNGATAGLHYVEITSGPAAGTTYDIASTTASSHSITTVQSLAANVGTSGVSFKIRKHWTLNSVFGSTSLNGTGDSNTADQVLIFNGTGYDIYYYQIDAFFGNGWRSVNDASADAGPTPLYPDNGILVKRKQAANVSVVLMGAVKTGVTSVPVFPNTNILANNYAAPITLADSGLRDAGGDPTKGVSDSSLAQTDQVLIWNGTGYDIYYYQVDAFFGNGWRSVNDASADAGPTQIPVGSSFIIKRKYAGAFNWVIPQHPATL